MYSRSFPPMLIAAFLGGGLNAVTLGKLAHVTERSSNSSCGQLYIAGYPAANCNSIKSVSTPIEATDGIITPLPWELPDIKSIRSLGATTNAPGCNVTLPLYPTQYMFYNLEGQEAGVAYLTLSQIGNRCIDFNNVSVTSYNGVSMLVPLPEGLAGLGSRV